MTSRQELRVLAIQLLIRQDEVAVRVAVARVNIARQLSREVTQELESLQSVLPVAVRGALSPGKPEVSEDDRGRSPRSYLS